MEKIHYAVLFSPRHDIELPLFNYISVCAGALSLQESFDREFLLP